MTLAPPLPGDATHEELTGETVYVQSGSYVAGDTGLDVDTEFGAAKTFFGSEGLVRRFEGPCRVWLQTRSPAAFPSWLLPKIPTTTHAPDGSP